MGDILLREKDYPKRQLNEFFSDYEVLSQKKQSDIASKDELNKLSKIKSFYSFYSDISKTLKEAKEKKNKQKVDNLILQIKNNLKKYGYE